MDFQASNLMKKMSQNHVFFEQIQFYFLLQYNNIDIEFGNLTTKQKPKKLKMHFFKRNRHPKHLCKYLFWLKSQSFAQQATIKFITF